jgi:hypothetical protein
MGWAVFLLLSLITSVYAAPFQHLRVRSDGSAVFFDNADATLFPSDSWDHDLFNLDNLTPKDSHKLYYTDSGAYGKLQTVLR